MGRSGNSDDTVSGDIILHSPAERQRGRLVSRYIAAMPQSEGIAYGVTMRRRWPVQRGSSQASMFVLHWTGGWRQL